MISVHFIFILDNVPKNEKNLHDSGTSTNTIDSNEVSTNAIVQTKYMHKTNDNRNNKKQTLVPQVIETK